eukprot:531933_1
MNMKQSLLNMSSISHTQLKESADDYRHNLTHTHDDDAVDDREIDTNDETSQSHASDLLFIERDDQASTSTESSTYPFNPMSLTKSSNLRPEAKEFIYNPIATVNPHAAMHGPHPHSIHHGPSGRLSDTFRPLPTQYIPYTLDTHRLLFLDGAALQRSNLSVEIKNFFIKNYKMSASKKSIRRSTVEMIRTTLNALQSSYVRQVGLCHNHLSRMNPTDSAWDVFVFGSESWNTQSIDSDVDVAIQLPFYTNRADKMFLLQELICALVIESVLCVLRKYSSFSSFNSPCILFGLHHTIRSKSRHLRRLFSSFKSLCFFLSNWCNSMQVCHHFYLVILSFFSFSFASNSFLSITFNDDSMYMYILR